MNGYIKKEETDDQNRKYSNGYLNIFLIKLGQYFHGKSTPDKGIIYIITFMG